MDLHPPAPSDFATRKRLWSAFRTARAAAAVCPNEGLCFCQVEVAVAEAAFLAHVRPERVFSAPNTSAS